MATHGLVPDAATTRMSTRIAPLLPSAAPERIRSELEKLLGASRVRDALRWAARTGVLARALGRELSPAAAGRAAALKALDARALRARPSAERVELRLAILARAIGMSGRQAEGWLRSRRFPRAQARDVAALLTLVDRARNASTDIQKWWWVRDAGRQAGASLRLAALLGEPGPAARSALAGRVRRAKRPPRVNGRDVQAWLGIPPGPAVGAALEVIEVEGLRGVLRTRSDARRWITGGPLTRPSRASVRSRRPAVGPNRL
jgi:tRNA nucleotidyltransferase/poly(A) polymerase